MRYHAFVLAGILSVLAASAGASTIDNPFGYFNVYSLGNIGTASSGYQSDIGGVVGAAKNVYFSSFSLDATDTTTGYGLHAGGSATLSGAYHKSLDVGGNVNLANVSVTGDVVSGGSILNSGGGSMTGSATAAGNVSLTQSFTVGGQKRSGVAYQPLIDFAAASNLFLSTSASIGAKAATGTVTNYYGQLSFTGVSGVNVVNVTSALLNSAWGFNITAPSGAIVYVNVLDASANLDSTNWNYLGGLTASDVLVNMPNALTLNLSGGNNVNLLAPKAATNFSSGQLTGELVVGGLQGGGQINLGHFTHGEVLHPVVTPEPATLAVLAIGGCLAVLRRRRTASCKA